MISYYVPNSIKSDAHGITLQNIIKNRSCKNCITLYKVKMFYFITILLTYKVKLLNKFLILLSLFFLLKNAGSCTINCNKCAFRVVWGSYILFKVILPNLLKLCKDCVIILKNTSVLYNMHFKSVTSKRVPYNKRINKKELFQEIFCSLLFLIVTLIYK